MGRWITPDPLGKVFNGTEEFLFSAEIPFSNNQFINLYDFNDNSPINFIDPYGTATWFIHDQVRDTVKDKLSKLQNVPLIPGKNLNQSIDTYANSIADTISNGQAWDLSHSKNINDIENSLVNQMQSQHPDWSWDDIQQMLNQMMKGAPCPTNK